MPLKSLIGETAIGAHCVLLATKSDSLSFMEDEPVPQYLKDEQRSAHGLGWEYRRRGQSIDENPFPLGSIRFESFRDGYANGDKALSQKVSV